MNDALWSRSATELTELIEQKQASPVEIAESVLDRIERHNGTLRAFLTVTADQALDEAKAAERRATAGERIGPLDGIPYSIKDLEATAGIRTTYGTKLHENHVPDTDSLTAARLRSSGGVLLGKTNTPAYGYKDMTENLLGGPCVNPWNTSKTPGGLLRWRGLGGGRRVRPGGAGLGRRRLDPHAQLALRGGRAETVVRARTGVARR